MRQKAKMDYINTALKESNSKIPYWICASASATSTQSCLVKWNKSIWNTGNLYFVIYSLLKWILYYTKCDCILYLKYIFQCNLYFKYIWVRPYFSHIIFVEYYMKKQAQKLNACTRLSKLDFCLCSTFVQLGLYI